jgi:DNA invertase Pin-like site-specific DNA recombinase
MILKTESWWCFLFRFKGRYFAKNQTNRTHENSPLYKSKYLRPNHLKPKAKTRTIRQLQGWEVDVFEETESSRNTRPVKAALLQKLRRKEYNGVLVYKLDRWARSSSELILEINELVNRGIGFYSLTENLDFGTATGKLMFNLLSAFAEFERDLIRERTMDGLNRAKQQGKRLGRPKGSKDKKVRKKGGYYLRRA